MSGRRGNPFENFRVSIDPEDIETFIKKVRDQAKDSFTAGRYTKVRVSYREKRLMPDIPLAVFLAGEGAAFFLLSPLSALIVNLGAGALLEVEFIHEADQLVQEGLSLYMDGELDEAEARYREALRRRSDDPAALYNLGTLLRVTSRRDEALELLRQAAMGPEGHPDVVRASEAVDRMTSGKRTL